jgi:hypothetical protein
VSRDIPKTNLTASPFAASNKSISTNKLSISNITQAQNTSTNANESTTNTNDKGEIAKSTAEAAQAFSTLLPGTSLAARIAGAKNLAKVAGSAYSNLNATRNNANDMANWQAMLKGSQETAKALADGLAKAFAGAGAVAQTLVAAAKKDGGKGGGGEESSSGKQQQQQSAQQSQQSQQMYAQSDAQTQGGAKA